MNTNLNLDYFFFSDDQVVNKYQDHQSLAIYQKGKHFRAKLLSLFGRIFNINPEYLHTMSRVIELVHNATLTHDDVIDRSLTRRSEPTIHEHLGNTRAILLGDYILAKALNELAQIKAYYLFQEISHSLKMLIDGEWMQYENISALNFTIQEYETLSINKTGSLFSWCLIAPYSLINQNQEQISTLREIGYTIGLIFQIKDDILDFSPNLNKTPYLDYSNNNPNIIMSLIDKSDTLLIQDIEKNRKFNQLTQKSKDKFAFYIDKAQNLITNKLRELDDKISSFTQDLPQDQKHNVNSLFDLTIEKIVNRQS